MSVPANGPYEGLKVLDLSQGIAGPYCGEILLQNGAEVIKVESPAGDWGRGIGYGPEGMSAMAIAFNIGKRSISIDAGCEEGRKLMRRLALQSDVLIESFRPGVMERLGLSYAELTRERPDLVYVSVTAFGPDGPYADRPGSDSTLQALTGMMVANRDSQGHPRKIGLLLVDVSTGVYAAQATGAALYRRALHGKGAHVQVSLLEAAAAVQSNGIVDEVMGGGQAARPLSVPAGTFATADGFVNVTSLHDRMFAGICRAIGKDEWASDPRFATVELRYEHADIINTELVRIFKTRPTGHWLRVLRENQAVCGQVNDYPQFLTDPHVLQQGIFRQVAQPGLPPLPIARVPGVPRSAAAGPAPRVGEHTREILAGIGLDEAEIEELLETKVVTAYAPSSSGARGE